MKNYKSPLAITLCAITIISFACSNKKKVGTITETTTQTTKALPDTTTIVSYERTACFGSCPVDKIEIKANGQATYKGKVFVDYIGTYNAQLSAGKLDTIFTIAEEINFFNGKDAYEPEYPISDLPSKFIMLHKPGNKKKVIDRSFAPESYNKLYTYLSTIIKETPWSVKP